MSQLVTSVILKDKITLEENGKEKEVDLVCAMSIDFVNKKTLFKWFPSKKYLRAENEREQNKFSAVLLSDDEERYPYIRLWKKIDQSRCCFCCREFGNKERVFSVSEHKILERTPPATTQKVGFSFIAFKRTKPIETAVGNVENELGICVKIKKEFRSSTLKKFSIVKIFEPAKHVDIFNHHPTKYSEDDVCCPSLHTTTALRYSSRPSISPDDIIKEYRIN